METLENSRMCRLCGKNSGIAVDIFDKNESHVRKINAILPILVHEMDLLPKQMCHRCSYKLEEFYNFYVECAKTDTELKSQLSWMRKENLEEKIITPMVKMNRFKIKTEPPDNNDSIDPSNVLGQISENSLVFPASILQHSFDLNTSPMVSCSRCRCLCNGSINVNKKSPKEMKEPSKTEAENQPHGSNVISNNSDNVSESKEPKSVDKNFSFNKDLFEVSNFKEISIKEIPNMNLNNGDCSKPNSVNGVKILKSENLNRALRPRKSSVDYMGLKKKGIATNLRAKFKSKLNMLDPSLVNPINIKTSQNNMVQTGPIIKLEKVDDTMRTLRTRKNLEEFNKRIKELQSKRNFHKNENQSRIPFLKDENQSRKSFLKEETQSRKSLHREEKQRRKSLQKEENLNRKRLQKEENPSRKSLQREENPSRKSLQREENINRKSLQREVEYRKSFLEQNEANTKCLTFNVKNDTNENVMRVMELKIKQEVFNKTIENNEPSEGQIVQEKPCEDEPSKDQTVPKPVERLPLCAVVKLEKDYTCNVDYPRIKIKRHLAVANSSKSQDGGLEVDSTAVDDKSFTTNDGNFSPKHLRSKEKRLRDVNEKNTWGKISKKKSKQLDLVKVKRTVLEKGSSVVSQTDLKRYCEECDTCFRNKELYRLHPCYQK